MRRIVLRKGENSDEDVGLAHVGKIYGPDSQVKSSKVFANSLQKTISRRCQKRALPLIPQSQDLNSFVKEPSYCTLLQQDVPAVRNSSLHRPRSAGTHRANEPTNRQDVYCMASMLDHLGEERIIYQSNSSASSSYAELKQATQHHRANYMHHQMTTSPKHSPHHFYDPIKQRLFVSKQRADASSAYEPIASDVKRISPLLPQPYFGECHSCHGKVVGEGRGCVAMGRIYHTSCFICVHCRLPLIRQAFFTVDGKPYCQEGYLSTLESCCVCNRPITERILRATGKPYHPNCFTCVVCRKSLDCVPFTVDAYNKVHCIEDFHRRYAPRCSVCRQPIMPKNMNALPADVSGQTDEDAVRIVAMDRSFHVQCYKCEDCGIRLSISSTDVDSDDRSCYPLDGHVLCKHCNTARITKSTGCDSYS